MKKTAFLILVFLLGTTFSFADDRGGTDSKTTASHDDSFYLGFGAMADFPGTNWSSNYNPGYGAQVFGGYQFDKNWGCSLELENVSFEGPAYSLYNFRGLASLKYTFSVEGWQPYLMAGAGTTFQWLSAAGGVTNLDALAGLGIQFDLTKDTHYFIEAKYNFILPSTGSYQDVPISTGIWVSL
jgi:hypothetical protein